MRPHMEQSASCSSRIAVDEKVMHEFDESAHFTVFIVSRDVYWIRRREMPCAEKPGMGRNAARQLVTVGQTCHSASLTKSRFTESKPILTQAGRRMPINATAHRLWDGDHRSATK